MSHLITFHWAKQVMWTSPKSMEHESIHFPWADYKSQGKEYGYTILLGERGNSGIQISIYQS